MLPEHRIRASWAWLYRSRAVTVLWDLKSAALSSCCAVLPQLLAAVSLLKSLTQPCQRKRVLARKASRRPRGNIERASRAPPSGAGVPQAHGDGTARIFCLLGLDQTPTAWDSDRRRGGSGSLVPWLRSPTSGYVPRPWPACAVSQAAGFLSVPLSFHPLCLWRCGLSLVVPPRACRKTERAQTVVGLSPCSAPHGPRGGRPENTAECAGAWARATRGRLQHESADPTPSRERAGRFGAVLSFYRKQTREKEDARLVTLRCSRGFAASWPRCDSSVTSAAQAWHLSSSPRFMLLLLSVLPATERGKHGGRLGSGVSAACSVRKRTETRVTR